MYRTWWNMWISYRLLFRSMFPFIMPDICYKPVDNQNKFAKRWSGWRRWWQFRRKYSNFTLNHFSFVFPLKSPPPPPFPPFEKDPESCLSSVFLNLFRSLITSTIYYGCIQTKKTINTPFLELQSYSRFGRASKYHSNSDLCNNLFLYLEEME